MSLYVPVSVCPCVCVSVCPCVSPCVPGHITQSPDPASVPPFALSSSQLGSSFDTFLEQFSSGMGRVPASQTMDVPACLPPSTFPSGVLGISVVTDPRAVGMCWSHKGWKQLHGAGCCQLRSCSLPWLPLCASIILFQNHFSWFQCSLAPSPLLLPLPTWNPVRLKNWLWIISSKRLFVHEK